MATTLTPFTEGNILECWQCTGYKKEDCAELRPTTPLFWYSVIFSPYWNYIAFWDLSRYYLFEGRQKPHAAREGQFGICTWEPQHTSTGTQQQRLFPIYHENILKRRSSRNCFLMSGARHDRSWAQLKAHWAPWWPRLWASHASPWRASL